MSNSRLTLCCLALFCIATVYGYDKGHTWGYKTEIHHPHGKHSKYPGHSTAYHVSSFQHHHSPGHYDNHHYEPKKHYDYKPAHYEHKSAHYEHKPTHYEHKPTHYEHKALHYDHYEPKLSHYEHKPSHYEHKPTHYEHKTPYYEQPKVIVKTVYKEAPPKKEEEDSLKIDIETPLKKMFQKFEEENGGEETEEPSQYGNNNGYGMYKENKEVPEEKSKGFEIKIPKINIDKMMGKGGDMDLKA